MVGFDPEALAKVQDPKATKMIDGLTMEHFGDYCRTQTVWTISIVAGSIVAQNPRIKNREAVERGLKIIKEAMKIMEGE